MMGPERKLKNKLGSPNDRQHHHLARQQIGHAECACRAGPIPALHGINGMIEGKIVTRNHGLNICMYVCMYCESGIAYPIMFQWLMLRINVPVRRRHTGSCFRIADLFSSAAVGS